MRIGFFILFFLGFFIIDLQGSNGTSFEYEFIENKGQWNSNIIFRAEIPGGWIFFEKDRFTYQTYDQEEYGQWAHAHSGSELLETAPPMIRHHAFQMILIGVNQDIEIEKSAPSKHFYNYFITNNKKNWASNVYGYGKILYHNVYQDIDLSVYSQNGNLKYDWIIHPGADPNVIKWRYDGIDTPELKDEGLILKTSLNKIVEGNPLAFQNINHRNKIVPCQFQPSGDEFGILINTEYNRQEILIIDPELKFSTFSGSISDNFGYTATFDSKGFLYAGGSAFGPQYPTTMGAYAEFFGGGTVDIGITKYDTTGTFRVYSTYVGGNNNELPHSMIVNSADELFIYGTTNSTNFPTTSNGYDQSFNGGVTVSIPGLGVSYTNGCDMFAVRLSEAGDELLAGTYLGGSGNDGISTSNDLTYNYADEIRGEILIDDNDHVYIASTTQSGNFPIIGNAIQANIDGLQDGVIAKLDNNLTTIIWSTFFGGNQADAIYSISLTEIGDPIICGGTTSNNLPTTTGVLEENAPGGQADGFVLKLSQDGSTNLGCTYFGTTLYDQAYFVELDNGGNIHLFGQTRDGNVLVENANYFNAGGGQFVTKLTPDMETVIWTTIFGNGSGFPQISPTAFLVDVCGKIYLSGWGSAIQGGNLTTQGLTVTNDAHQGNTDNRDFYLMVMEDDASDLVYATYFGGPLSSEHVDGGTSRFDRTGKIYQSVCAGCGGNDDFPIFPSDAVSATNNSTNCNNAVFKFDFELPVLIAEFDHTPTCLPDPVNFTNFSNGGTDFFWDFGDNTNSTDPNPIHLYDEPGTYTVTLIADDPMSCNISDTITHTVVILSTEDFELENLAVCSGVPVQIGIDPIGNGDYTFNWSPEDGLSDPTASNPIASPTSTITYTLIINNGICTSQASQQIEIIDLELEELDDFVFCAEGDTILIEANTNGTATQYIWSSNPNFSDTLNANLADSILEVIISSEMNIYVQVSNLNCELEEVSFIISDIPEIELVDTTALCLGEEVQLVAINQNPGSPVTYVWEPNVAITSALNNATITASPTENVTLYVSGINDSGCTWQDSTQLDVYQLELIANPDTLICDGTSLLLVANSFGDGDNFIWSTSPTFNPVISNDSTVIVTPDANTIYYIQATNPGCEAVETVNVVLASNQIELSPNQFICEDEIATITLTNLFPSIDIDLMWSPESSILSGQGTESITVDPSVGTWYFVDALTENGCVIIDSVFIGVSTLLVNDVLAYADTSVIPLGGSTMVFGEPIGNYQYIWSPQTGLQSPNSSSSVASPTQTTLYTLTIIDSSPWGSCTRSDSVLITVFEFPCQSPAIFVPNAFTPNNDGNNDEVFVRGNYINNLFFAIYDRWGEKVFETNSQDEGWDGTYKGQDADPAVYVYYLELDCIDGQHYFTKGNITLIR